MNLSFTDILRLEEKWSVRSGKMGINLKQAVAAIGGDDEGFRSRSLLQRRAMYSRIGQLSTGFGAMS